MESEAGAFFVHFLQTNSVPEELWDQLVDKIGSGDIDVGFEVSSEGPLRMLARASLEPAQDVYILPHIFCASRPTWIGQVHSNSDFREECAKLMNSKSSRAADVEAELWEWLQPSSRATQANSRALTAWHLEPQEGLWMRHSESPNARVVALPPEISAAIGSGSVAPHGASIVWLTASVKEGEEVSRDQLPGQKSIQRAAALLCLCKAPRWREPSELEAVKAAVESAVSCQLPPGFGAGPQADASPSDTRPTASLVSGKKQQRLLYTNYPNVQENLTAPQFRVTESAEEADTVMTPYPIRDFVNRNQTVNQFPYEACLVRKDLLPQTLRRLQSTLDPTLESGEGPSACHPSWFPASYDLATEVHFFLQDFRQRRGKGESNYWVVKLAQGARSMDTCLTDNAATAVRYRSAPGGDRVVQRYVRQPVLFRGRKFDLRVYLLVKSFQPLDAYLCREYYARVANKPYSLDPDRETDFETHFTVAAYEEEEAKAAAQLMVPKAEALEELQAACGITESALDAQLKEVALQVLTAASFQIGKWPLSRAVYGMDVLILEQAASANPGQPWSLALLEINFCPDFTSVLRFHPRFVDDVLLTLFMEEALPESMIPLRGAGAGGLDAID